MPILTNQASRFLGGSRAPAAPVPVAGAELLTNGGFSAWTGDNPNSWNVVGESGMDPMITQTANGARFLTSGAYVEMTQSSLAPNAWMSIDGALAVAVAGSLRVVVGGTIADSPSTAAAFYAVARAATNVFTLARNVAGSTNDFTIASISAKRLTLSSLISTRPYASPDCDISVAVTRTADTQAGLCARLDSASSPANFIIAYETGAGRVRVDKCVAGVYTNIIDGAVTYAAGRVLRLVCAGNDVSVYYNGAQVGSTVTVSDAGIVSNKNHGKFSTYASNVLANYVAA